MQNGTLIGRAQVRLDQVRLDVVGGPTHLKRPRILGANAVTINTNTIDS